MYAIRKTRSFFGKKDVKGWVTDGFGPRGEDERALFQSQKVAQAVADRLDQEVYVTAHDESGRPEYKVVRVNA